MPLSRQQKGYLYLLISAVSLLAIAAILYDWLRPPPTLVYEHAAAGIKMAYPIDWTKKEDFNNTLVSFISPKENELDTFQENVNFVIQDISQSSMTLSQYAQTAETQLSAVFAEGVEILESGPAHMADQPAYKLVYNLKAPTPVRIMHISIIQKQKVYQLTYSAADLKFKEYLKIFNRMVNSFEIK